MIIHHEPVFLDKILHEILKKSDKFIIDATLGEGGHSEAFLKAGYSVLGIDRDAVILEKARARLAPYGQRFQSVNMNFGQAATLFDEHRGRIDLALFDLGISQFHYRESGRGFTFNGEEPLDMRLEKDAETSAADVVNRMSESEIATILHTYSEERHSRRIARRIVEKRKLAPITTSGQLASLIKPLYPPQSPIHPATRTFQALRIFVNRELDAIAPALEAAVRNLNEGGRVAVMAYHSLEDRIVKGTFRSYLEPKRKVNRYREASSHGAYRLMWEKPLAPDEDEVRRNPSARSAKLRVLVRELKENAPSKDGG